MGLVFERFDTDVKEFLKTTAVKIPAMRHVLRSSLAALDYMHDRGILHADLKTSNILLRSAGAFRQQWYKQLRKPAKAASATGAVSPTPAASASSDAANEHETLVAAFQLPALFEVRGTDFKRTLWSGWVAGRVGVGGRGRGLGL